MTGAFVLTPARVRAAWPFIPFIAKPGAVYVGPTGETMILRPDGGADPVRPFGFKSIASEPLAFRGSALSAGPSREAGRAP